ncbi:MAG: hypothetical protein J5966_00540 [Lachnospiraceae bacterium]|nr:hypothetical protein [Lachnospiraceae bacterium]
MKYDDFNELVRARLADICGSEFSVSIYEAMKNNSVIHKGISIKEKDNRIAPTIYMEEFYTDYCDGRDIEDIVNEILRVYSENRTGPDIETERFSDFEWVKDRIFFRLINAHDNAAMLQQVPSFVFLDLALVFGVYMGNFRKAFSSVMIRKEHMEMWHTDEEELRRLAAVNTPRILPSAIWTIKDLLDEMGVPADDISNETPTYILSNKERINGAAVMVYDGVLRKFASNLGTDLFILPSSVHELILVPECSVRDPESLMEMIAEVNDTQVSKEELLSYTLYKYAREKDLVETVKSMRSKKVASA